MAKTSRIAIAGLNLSASPHPPGIYEDLLNAASEIEVPVWGSDWALITRPQRRAPPHKDWLHGRILLSTHIKRDGPWLNRKKRDVASREESKKASDALPADLEPNYRSFHYVFLESKHRLIYESQNELGERFGPSRAEAFFQRLFDPDHLPQTAPKATVDVTTIPEHEALDRILSMAELRRLEIVVKRPNPDYGEDEFNEIMKDLEEQGARTRRTELVKSADATSLIPNEGTRKLAAIAAENGHVKGEGRDAHGEQISESTSAHPRIRYRDLVHSSLETLFAATRLFL